MDHTILLALGRRKSGKTTLVRDLVQRAEADTLILVYDQYRNFRPEHGFERQYRSLEAFRADVEAGEFRQDENEDAPETGVAVFAPMGEELSCDALAEEAIRLRDCVLVVDELDAVCKGGGTQIREQHLRQIVEYGRHLEVTLIGGARRAAAVHRSITAGADKMYIFRLTEPNDLDYIKDYCGADFAEQVRQLPKCPACDPSNGRGRHLHRHLTWPDDCG